MKIRRLDDRLAEGIDPQLASTFRREFPCTFEESNRPGGVVWIDLDCRDADEPAVAIFRMHLQGQPEHLEGEITWFRLPEVLALSRLQVRRASLDSETGELRIDTGDVRTRAGLRGRLPDGRRFETIRLHRSTATGSAEGIGKRRGTADLEVVFVDDFVIVRQALDRMLVQGLADPGHGLSRSGIFVPGLMRALFEELGLEPVDWFEAAENEGPPQFVHDEGGAEEAAAGGDHALVTVLERHCATCHRSEHPFPPNFLGSDTVKVPANIRHCAPRMLYRLKMWQLSDEMRGKTPMPPFGTPHLASGESQLAGKLRTMSS